MTKQLKSSFEILSNLVSIHTKKCENIKDKLFTEVNEYTDLKTLQVKHQYIFNQNLIIDLCKTIVLECEWTNIIQFFSLAENKELLSSMSYTFKDKLKYETIENKIRYQQELERISYSCKHWF